MNTATIRHLLKLAAVVPAALLATACASSDGAQAGGAEADVAAVGASHVKLVWAGASKGVALVDDLGPDKKVTFHYRWNGLNWLDSVAEPGAKVGGRQYFSAQLPDVATEIKAEGNAEVEFAIKYTVNGKTYWDNNRTKNYVTRQRSNWTACNLHEYTNDPPPPVAKPGDCSTFDANTGTCWDPNRGYCKVANAPDTGKLLATGPGFAGDFLFADYGASDIGGSTSGSSAFNSASFKAIVPNLPGLTAVEIVGDQQKHVIPFTRSGLKNDAAEVWSASWRGSGAEKLSTFHVNLKFGGRVQMVTHGGKEFTCTWGPDATCDVF